MGPLLPIILESHQRNENSSSNRTATRIKSEESKQGIFPLKQLRMANRSIWGDQLRVSPDASLGDERLRAILESQEKRVKPHPAVTSALILQRPLRFGGGRRHSRLPIGGNPSFSPETRSPWSDRTETLPFPPKLLSGFLIDFFNLFQFEWRREESLWLR